MIMNEIIRDGKLLPQSTGDFFDINLVKKSSISNKWRKVLVIGDYYKSVSDSTVGFTNNGTVNSLIGGESWNVHHIWCLVFMMKIMKLFKHSKLKNVNTVPGANEASVYYANWNKEKQIVPIQVPNG